MWLLPVLWLVGLALGVTINVVAIAATGDLRVLRPTRLVPNWSQARFFVVDYVATNSLTLAASYVVTAVTGYEGLRACELRRCC